jgi:hypothetical protein
MTTTKKLSVDGSAPDGRGDAVSDRRAAPALFPARDAGVTAPDFSTTGFSR